MTAVATGVLVDAATQHQERLARLRSDEAWDRVRARWELARRDPIEFQRHFVWTIDQHDKEDPIKKWPWRKPYLQYMTRLWQHNRLLSVLKSRQMRMTWLFVILGVWDWLFHDGRLIMLQSKREEDAIGDENSGDGLLGRSKAIMNLMPYRERLVPSYIPLGKRMLLPERNSTLWAIPQGGGIIRQRTASGILSDECAFQPEFGDAYVGARPTVRGGGWFVALSTADLTDGGTFRDLHNDSLSEHY